MRKLKRMIRPFQAKQSQDKILIDYHSSVNVLSVNIILTGTQWINTLTALFTRLTAANHKQSLPHSYKKKQKKHQRQTPRQLLHQSQHSNAWEGGAFRGSPYNHCCSIYSYRQLQLCSEVYISPAESVRCLAYKKRQMWPWTTKPVIRANFSKLRFIHNLKAE